MKSIIVSLIMLVLISCSTLNPSSSYLPSATRAASDIAVTALLSENVVTLKEMLKVHGELTALIVDKDLTTIMYNDMMSDLLKKYPGSSQLVFSLLIVGEREVSARITGQQKYLIMQGLNQMKVALDGWNIWKALEK